MVSGAWRAKLGESPVWDAELGCLWFLDIIAPCVGCIAATSSEDAPKLWRLPNWCVAAAASSMRLRADVATGLAASRCARAAACLPPWRARRTTAAASCVR